MQCSKSQAINAPTQNNTQGRKVVLHSEYAETITKTEEKTKPRTAQFVTAFFFVNKKSITLDNSNIMTKAPKPTQAKTGTFIDDNAFNRSLYKPKYIKIIEALVPGIKQPKPITAPTKVQVIKDVLWGTAFSNSCDIKILSFIENEFKKKGVRSKTRPKIKATKVTT